MPVVPSDFEYQFSSNALKQVREKLGLSQAKLAERLDLPVNTVSRWERGETTPDANSLAAIYSISKERGLEPEFFQKEARVLTITKRVPAPLNGRRVLNRQRTRLGLMWDFQNVALNDEEAYDTWFYMEKFLDMAFPEIENWELRVFASWAQNESAVKGLRNFHTDWVSVDADAQIKREIRRFCGLPGGTLFPFSQDSFENQRDKVLIVVSRDGDFADVLYEADQAGIDVYLWTPPGCSKDLVDAVRRDHIIPWNHPCIIVSEDNLNRLKR